ncbi:response regulator [Amorphus orientalis]|uniref:CheY-like chemotaxis protein n=1 Tax=Amorphus orientalis TaxID=649198 RepID=A0AAE3VKJ8_9HYPH|nr:response regulator [Amorphus orientalis]MDQ0313834.1 CheY-like chemotaxis protein [Amorphus orientalis]
MSIAMAIAPHLPYLRRFARALTGSQTGGDAYVAACLEAIIEDPSLFDESLEARVATYRVLLSIWDSIDLNSRVDPGDLPHERNLEAMTPKARQAFLLTTVEGFSTAQAATILKTDEAAVSALLDEAGREIANQVSTTVMIIEDEPLIAMDIEVLVEGLGHDVAGIARTHSEASELARATKPGMILADIQLADGSSGLDAVNELLQELDVPVIFITAYPERLLTGERPEPAFLVTKPFEPEVVKAVISQALFFDTRAGKSHSSVAAAG